MVIRRGPILDRRASRHSLQAFAIAGWPVWPLLDLRELGHCQTPVARSEVSLVELLRSRQGDQSAHARTRREVQWQHELTANENPTRSWQAEYRRRRCRAGVLVELVERYVVAMCQSLLPVWPRTHGGLDRSRQVRLCPVLILLHRAL